MASSHKTWAAMTRNCARFNVLGLVTIAIPVPITVVLSTPMSRFCLCYAVPPVSIALPLTSLLLQLQSVLHKYHAPSPGNAAVQRFYASHRSSSCVLSDFSFTRSHDLSNFHPLLSPSSSSNLDTYTCPSLNLPLYLILLPLIFPESTQFGLQADRLGTILGQGTFSRL